MAIALRYAARTDVGLVRSNNQDSGYAGPHLLVIADGMGGHAGGDIASSITVGELAALDGESIGADALERLRERIAAANDELRERIDHDPHLSGMGTTVTALLRTGNRLAMAHIGDSRGYLLRDGQLTQITRDHSFVQTLIDEGRISAEDAEQHPQRNLVMRVLTGQPDDEPDLSMREARVGDRYLLCSDGLSGYVSDETLADTMTAGLGVDETAERLVALALRAGGPDNITVVVADVVEVGADAPSTNPTVVGAAALNRGNATSAAPSPAAKAAALGRPNLDGTPTEEPDEGGDSGGGAPSRGRRALRLLAVLVVLAVLGAGGWAAYQWSQQQYFVGPAGANVAIYRGMVQDVGPIKLSSVAEHEDISLNELPVYSRQRVKERISAQSLSDARAIVSRLRSQAAQCAAGESKPTATTAPPAASPPAGATPAPTSPGATPSPTGSPTPSGGHSPAVDCTGVG